MATLTGTSLALTDTLFDDASRLLGQTYATTTAEIGGTTFVYATSLLDGGVQVATLTANGQLTPVGTYANTSGAGLSGTWGAQTFEAGGNAFLAVAGTSDSSVSIFALSDSAPYLTLTDTVFQSDSPNHRFSAPISVDVLTLSGGTFLYVNGYSSDGISVFSVDAAGTMTNVQNVSDGGTLELQTARTVKGFSRDGTQYLLATGEVDDGVTVFSVNQTTGLLTEAASLDGAATAILDAAYLADAVTIGTTTYLYVPEEKGDAITVLAFDGSSISVVQRITGSATLDRALEASVIEAGDRLLLTVSAFGSDKLSVYEIDNDPLSANTGSLSILDVLDDNAGVGALTDIVGTTSVTVDGTPYLLVNSGGDSALNVYEIGGGDDLIEGTALADNISGGSGMDTLYGLGGNDLIRGDGGDDMVYGGTGSDTIAGNDGADTIRGGLDNDALYGGADNDVLAGNDGNDFLRGGTGDDALYGGDGNDDLDGEAGSDSLDGGLGDDLLRGGEGGDLLHGRNGMDTLAGNAGNDTLYGGSDDDRLIGGAGTDQLWGGGGADVFVFDNIFHSPHGAARDTIHDFTAGVDKIDLSGFAGTLSFTGSAYTGAGNEVRYSQPTGRLYVDIDGDMASDFSVDVVGNPALTVDDLIL